ERGADHAGAGLPARGCEGPGRALLPVRAGPRRAAGAPACSRRRGGADRGRLTRATARDAGDRPGPLRAGDPPGRRRGRRNSGSEPGIALDVLAGVVRVEVDEDALDLPVPDLEDVAPAPGPPFGHARAPGAVAVLAVARALAHHDVRAGEDPVELGVVVDDGP